MEPLVEEEEPAFEEFESTASDELVAQVTAGGALSFEPEPEEDEALLPVHGRPIEAHPSRPTGPDAASETEA
jgi:hypothetical protein